MNWTRAARWSPLWIGLLVAGCGGGGGDSGGGPVSAPEPVASSLTFPVQAGYKARLALGASDDFKITGTCAGTAQITNSPTAPATFEGTAALAATQTATVNFTNCQPANSSASGTNYFDANFVPLGTMVTGLEYSSATPAPTVAPSALPTTVSVDDSAVYGTFTTYVNSTKGIATGQRVLSYVIERDTATTAILDLVAKTYDTSDDLLLTQQTRFRIAADGTLTLLTIDVQYSTTSTVHLIYAKV